jgi:hypothetical protein
MSSMFEAPPSRRSGSWLKVVTAFVAGAVVALAISRVPTILYGSPQPVASSRVPATGVRTPIGQPPDASKPAVPEPSRAHAEVRENTLPAAEARDVPAQAVPTATPGPAAEGKSCAWPYVDQRCAESDTNSGQATQSVRVIPTDRSASPTLATTVAPSVPPEPKPTGNVTGAGPASVAPAAAAPAVAAPAAIVEPSGRPAVARGAGERVPGEPGSRLHKPTRSKEPKTSSIRKKEAARAKTLDQQSRTGRSRTLDERDDAARDPELADSALIRTHILPGGRRVSVYRELNMRDDARAVGRGEIYRARRLPVPPSYHEDEDDD